MVEVKNLSIEETFEKYYNNLPKEQYKGFKNEKSWCCKDKSLVNNSGEVVCKFCGQVSHYEMAIENKNYWIRRKSKYHRKYHIKNILNDNLLQNYIYLSVEEMCNLFRIFENVALIFFRLYPKRKRLIKLKFIIYKIFVEEGFEEYNIFSVFLSEQAEKKYNEIWDNIKNHLKSL